jgi:hypothetical protein
MMDAEDAGSALAMAVGVGVGEVEDRQRRGLLLDCLCAAKAIDQAEVVSNGFDHVINRLFKGSAPQMPPQPAAAERDCSIDQGIRILAISGDYYRGPKPATAVAHEVYRNSAFARSFQCKTWVDLKYEIDNDKETLAKILDELTGRDDHRLDSCFDVEALAIKLQEHLKGKRFLIVLENVAKSTKEALQYLQVTLVCLVMII